MYKNDYTEEREKHAVAETHQKVLISFKEQLEKISNERDSWKYDAEQRKKDNSELVKENNEVVKENKKMKEQVRIAIYLR